MEDQNLIKKGYQSISISLVIFIVFLIYLWIAQDGSGKFNLYKGYSNGGYYNLLTDAFIKRQLHLHIKPNPELLKLDDPYDPISNGRYRLHDASLYHGKYYLYFGPTPVITLYLPYRILTGKKLSNAQACFIYLFGSFIWITLTLLYLKEKYFKQIPRWMLIASLFVLAFGNLVPFLLSDTFVYEVCISSGIFFLTGAIYFLTKAARGVNVNTIELIYASLFLGLSIGARPNLLLCSILLMFIFFQILRNNKLIQNKEKIKIGLILLTPILLCLLALGIYNFKRFDNFFETGHKYQLTIRNMRKYQSITLESGRIIPNFYLFFLKPPTIDNNFPFVSLNYHLPHTIKTTPGYRYDNRSLGMIPTIPFTLLPLFCILIFYLLNKKDNKTQQKTAFPKNEFLILILSVILIISSLMFIQASNMRYMAEILPYMLLISCITWYYYYINLEHKPFSITLINTFALVTISVTIAFNFAIGLIKLERWNNEQFNNIKRLFVEKRIF